MPPDLTDRERERFARLRESLEGIERAEPGPSVTPQRQPIDPMLASTFRGDLDQLPEDEWIAERKFDGTRIILQKFDGTVSLYTRRHIDRAETLAELTSHAERVLPDGIIIDGEYCFLTPDGVSRFLPIHQSGTSVDRENLSSTFFVFDVLAADGGWCLRDQLLDRKSKLFEIISDDAFLSPVDHETSSFQSFYDELIDAGEEGIVIKRRSSPYHPGVRSDHWRKVKAFTEADVLAVGYTEGEGRRRGTFGALVLSDGERYLGRAGSGFNRDTLADLSETMDPVDVYPISPKTVGRSYTPIEPLVIRVKFQEINRHGKLRSPVFLGRNTEKPIEDIEPLGELADR